MSFNPNIPQPGDKLSDSQQELLDNNGFLNTGFGIDHYTFSDATANNGKHNKVTTPIIVGGVDPITAVDEPIFFANKRSASFPTIQFSRGASNAVSSPVTLLQSPAVAIVLAPSTSIDVLDLTGISFAHGLFIASSTSVTPVNMTFERFKWGPAVANSLTAQVDGSGTLRLFFATAPDRLILRNTSASVAVTDIFWTLQLYRVTV